MDQVTGVPPGAAVGVVGAAHCLEGGGNKVNEVTVWINELFLNNTT